MGKTNEGMAVFILLDRTGSMGRLWEEAVSSVNAYVRELIKDGADDKVTLAVFDAYEQGLQFDVLRDAVQIGDWKELLKDEVSPRGTTPLFDALAKLISRAEEADNDRTAIVVMTDGHENASVEVSKDSMKATLDRVQAKKWQVNFLGADFDGFDQAAQLGVAPAQVMNFFVGQAGSAMASTAQAHSRYRQNRSAESYRKEDRKKARENDVGKN